MKNDDGSAVEMHSVRIPPPTTAPAATLQEETFTLTRLPSLRSGHGENGKSGDRRASVTASTSATTSLTKPSGSFRGRIQRFWRRIKPVLKTNLVLIVTLAGVIAGIVLGIILKRVEINRGYPISSEWRTIIGFPGEIFLRMLKLLIVPLVASALVSGLGQLDLSFSKRMARRAFLYYIGTNVIAVLLGVACVVVIHPGSPAIKANAFESTGGGGGNNLTTMDAMLDLIRNLFPDNLVQIGFMFTQSSYKTKHGRVPISNFNTSTPNNLTTNTPPTIVGQYMTEVDNVTHQVRYYRLEERHETGLEPVYGVNMLGLIVFFLVFGLMLATLRHDPNSHTVLSFFVCMYTIVMKLIMLVMWYSPLGIASLIAGKIISTDNLLVLLTNLLWLVATVLIALSIHLFVVLPLIFFIFTRKNPYVFMKGVLQAWLIGLATASSAAAIPFTLRCLAENNKIDPRVTHFVVPVGATVNMNGTALYEAVATIFIGQINGFSLPFIKLITISITATLAAIGAAAVPSAGLVTLVIILSSVGFPVGDISLIVTVDWLLDRFRTSVNVMDDAMGAGLVYYRSKAELDALDARTAAAAETKAGAAAAATAAGTTTTTEATVTADPALERVPTYPEAINTMMIDDADRTFTKFSSNDTITSVHDDASDDKEAAENGGARHIIHRHPKRF